MESQTFNEKLMERRAKRKVTALNAMTTIAYCFCFVILIIWASVAVAFIRGDYTPKKIYAKDLSIKAEENAKVEMIAGYPVLRVNGITESDNPNVLVDSSFIVNGGTEPELDEDGNVIDENQVTEKKIKLTSSNVNVVTVPAEANIGEPIMLTVTKNSNNINNGGFCFIYVQNDRGLYMSKPLVVFVDIPIEDLIVSSNSMQKITEDDIEKFMLYQDESASVSTQMSPANSVDPSHLDENSDFNAFRKSAKRVEYGLADESAKDVITIDRLTGNIIALKPGEAIVEVKALRTYDDIDFVNNYDSNITEWGDYIPPELLDGRYVTQSFIVKVEEVSLEAIEVSSRPITLPLFEPVLLSTSDLGVSLIASNGNNDYFAEQLKNIVVTSNSKELRVVKDNKTGNWEFTVLQDPKQGLEINITLDSAPDLGVKKTEFNIEQKGIKELRFEGTSKSNADVAYNDLIEITIKKVGDAIQSDNYTFDWSDCVTIIPMSGNADTSYKGIKVFAVGAYHNNTEYKSNVFVNELDSEIISLGSTIFTGFGREVRGQDLLNPKLIEAISRGNISLKAYVIKTDKDGNAIDVNGDIIRQDAHGNVLDEENNIITNNIPSFVSICESNEITVKIIEQITELSVYADIEDEAGNVQEQQLVATSQSMATNVLAVNSISTHRLQLSANSVGALFDAYTNTSLSGAWLRATSSDNSIVLATVEQDANDKSKYYLVLDVHNLNITSEYKDIDLKMEYYTGDKLAVDGYSILTSFTICIIEVPVESIKMNVNTEATTTIDGIDCYWLSGSLNIRTDIKNSRQEVSDLTSVWVKVDSGTGAMSEFLIGAPTLTAGQVQILQDLDARGQVYVLPKPLAINNTGSIYNIHLNRNAVNTATDVARLVDVATPSGEVQKKLEIHELNTEFYITVSSTYSGLSPIMHTICVRADLLDGIKNLINFQQNENDLYEINAPISSLHLNVDNTGGYDLRNVTLFEPSFRLDASTCWISGDSEFLAFEVCSDSQSKVKNEDDRLSFANQATDALDANINVIILTKDGLKIRQKYTIHFM